MILYDRIRPKTPFGYKPVEYRLKKWVKILIAIGIVAMIPLFYFIEKNNNADEYSQHICEDVYGLTSDCK